MGLQMSRPTWGPLGGHFLHPKTSFLCSDGIDTPWKSSGKQRETAVTNLVAVGVPTGHRCSPRVPRLLQGSSGRQGTKASSTQCWGPTGLPAWETSLSSQCSQAGLTAASIPSSTGSLPGTGQVSSHLSQPSGPPQIFLGFKLFKVRLQLL